MSAARPPPPTLDEIGISRIQAARWRRAASILAGTFERPKVEAGLTSAGVLRLAEGQVGTSRRAPWLGVPRPAPDAASSRAIVHLRASRFSGLVRYACPPALSASRRV